MINVIKAIKVIKVLVKYFYLKKYYKYSDINIAGTSFKNHIHNYKALNLFTTARFKVIGLPQIIILIYYQVWIVMVNRYLLYNIIKSRYDYYISLLKL